MANRKEPNSNTPMLRIQNVTRGLPLEEDLHLGFFSLRNGIMN